MPSGWVALPAGVGHPRASPSACRRRISSAHWRIVKVATPAGVMMVSATPSHGAPTASPLAMASAHNSMACRCSGVSTGGALRFGIGPSGYQVSRAPSADAGTAAAHASRADCSAPPSLYRGAKPGRWSRARSSARRRRETMLFAVAAGTPVCSSTWRRLVGLPPLHSKYATMAPSQQPPQAWGRPCGTFR